MSALRRSLALAAASKLALAQAVGAFSLASVAVMAPSPARATCPPTYSGPTIGADADCIFRDYEIDGNSSSGAHNPIKSEIREWGNVIGNKVAYFDPRDFGAKCDGATNDYTALQNWANSVAPNVVLVLPPTPCATATPIVFPVSYHWSLIGDGPSTSEIRYIGAATNVDILVIGATGGSAFYGVTLKDFNIRSNTTMTGGYALHAFGMSSGVISNVWADAWNSGGNNGKLCGGFWFDGVFELDILNPNMSSGQGCGDGIMVNNTSGFSPGSAEVRIVGGNIGGSPGGFVSGLHMAGGFGGLRCDGTNIAANTYGLLIDNAHAGQANREFTQGSTCVFDNNVSAGVKLNDTLVDGGSGGAGGTVDLAGWIASTTAGHGLEITAWKNSDVIVRGNKVYNNCGSGVYVGDATTRVNLSAATSINNNGNSSVSSGCPTWQSGHTGHGYGVEAASATTLIFGFPAMWSNAAGDFNANAGLSVRLPLWASGLSLPTCDLAHYGWMVAVDNANSPTYHGALSRTGSVRVPAFCDGSGTWKTH